MTHFAFVSSPLAGHVNPLLTLAGELVRRGHRVTFVHQADAAVLVARSPVAFAAVGEGSHPAGSLEASVRRMARLGVVDGVGDMIRDVATTTGMLCRELPDAYRALGVDAVVADQMEPAGGLVARHLRLPFVTTATGLPINRELGVPPPYVPWGYRDTVSWRRLNLGGWRVTDLLMRKVNRTICDYAATFGLTGLTRTEDCFSSVAQLAQCVRGLDFPRRELPAGFHYLGPFREDGLDEVELDEKDGRPLVYCSLGTIQGSRAEIFEAVARACHELDLRLLIAHGGRLDPAVAARLPGAPIVRDFVPQRAVLAHASLVVGHAGFNTVLDALSFGVPMVAMPLAFEQPATAARLRRAGVAEVLYGRFTQARLKRAIARVLGEPSYRARAHAFASEIAEAGGVRRAVDIIEGALGLGARREVLTMTATAFDGARDDSRSESR